MPLIGKMAKKFEISPMMKHYLKTKEEYEDCILFYRLGDFYEMFFTDAMTVSRELELTLTGKECGMEERAPMCGVPFHSASTYIERLISRGYKVAICEQVEDPKNAKGIVRREVVRVVTPGTVTDENLLDERSNNYLAVLYAENGTFGFAVTDVSTGEMYASELEGAARALNELARYSPKEVIMNLQAANGTAKELQIRFHLKPEIKTDEFFNIKDITAKVSSQFGGKSLNELDLQDKPKALKSVGAALVYLEYAQKSRVAYIDKLNVYSTHEYMELDIATRRNLEITETMRDKSKRGSIFWVMDNTKTSMGARLLKQWIEKPLLLPEQINKRLESVKELAQNLELRNDLRELLSSTYDISRIISRLSLNTANPRDMVALKNTLIKLPGLVTLLKGAKSELLSELARDFDVIDDVREMLSESIDDDAPAFVRDGGVISTGFSEELDHLRKARDNGGEWLSELEAKERDLTGIPKLKVGYNKVFGYYIEVTRSYMDMVPDRFVRKQTLANTERYITQELKEIENTILGAAEKIQSLEAYIFEEIRKAVVRELERIKRAAEVIAVSDVIASLAETAWKNDYVMPVVDSSGVIEIKDGRHPVVEKMIKNSMFVANDTLLNCDDDRLLMITGPNMAGKSTYMRQVAVITLMAQIGSFVPAKSAHIGVVDKIFTRVGASDDIAAGQSTFMLEMSEVSNILKNATNKSLIILDEIGRGTSTFDGLSIAWAVAEYVQNKRKVGAKTLFATHYHELIELENQLDGVKNYNIAVKKRGDDITFLRKIVRGGADDSYGIEVAALAGVPHSVIARAKEILKKIEQDELTEAYKSDKKPDEPQTQMGFADMEAMALIREIAAKDVTTFTPIEALNELYRLALKAKEIAG